MLHWITNQLYTDINQLIDLSRVLCSDCSITKLITLKHTKFKMQSTNIDNDDNMGINSNMNEEDKSNTEGMDVD